MAQKVIDVTRYKDHYDELSKTPKNYAKDNYFLKELQDKVNAEWNYRPNRVDIEYEAKKGTMRRAIEKHYGDDRSLWKPIEVVIQSVRSEKGTAISNDCRRIVFKNILEDRFNIGSKFRFTPDYMLEEDLSKYKGTYAENLHSKKNVWLATNLDQVKMTSSVVIERCNGTLISTYVDAQNIVHYHSEPVIQGANLSSVSMFYNETAVLPQSELLIIAQHNDFTRQYHINQRFIVGYDRVYRIKAINKFYSNSTNNPEDVGLIRIYMELTEISPYDDFEKRVAYQQDQEDKDSPIDVPSTDTEYRIVFKTPETIPNTLPKDFIEFSPMVIDSKGEEHPEIPLYVSCSLERLPESMKGKEGLFFTLEQDGNNFKIKRNNIYTNGNLVINCAMGATKGTDSEDVSVGIKLQMR